MDSRGRSRHDAGMQVGDADGHGRYGVLDEDAEGLMCHECGERFVHLGLHAYKAHGVTAKDYRKAHGLGSRGLVAEGTRRAIATNARAQMPLKSAFSEQRDPARATAVRRAAGSVISPAGLEAIRKANVARRGQHRLGGVVVCEWCGVEFCPLVAAKKRRFCSRSCASRCTRARGAKCFTRRDREVSLSVRPRPRPLWLEGPRNQG